jgi:hypothetical protein
MVPAVSSVRIGTGFGGSYSATRCHPDKIHGPAWPATSKVVRRGTGLLPLKILGTFVRIELSLPRTEVGSFRMINPEYLVRARFVRPSKVELAFADGLTVRRSFTELGIDPDELRLAATRASQSGNALEVQTRSGQTVSIDSASIRYLVDPAYAERLEAATSKLDIPSDKLDELAEKYLPPQSWYGSADEKPW